MGEQIPPEVLRRMKEHFQRLDLDGDGHLTGQEIAIVFRNLGVNIDPESLKAMVAEVDNNNNGMLEFEDFVQLIERHAVDNSLWSQLLRATANESINPQLHLTDEQIQKLRQFFDKLDLDRNGHLSVAELHLLLNKQLKINVSVQQVMDMIAQADSSNNGQIEFEEFLILVCNLKNHDSGLWGQLLTGIKAQPDLFSSQQLDELRRHFDQLDLDGNGHVTASELYLMFKALKVPVTQETLDKLIQQADLNQNGQIEFDEFISLAINLKENDENAWTALFEATKPSPLTRMKSQALDMFGITNEAQKRNIQYYQSKSFFQRKDQRDVQKTDMWGSAWDATIGRLRGQPSPKPEDIEIQASQSDDVIRDPAVRSQLKKQYSTDYKPIFLALVTLAQIAMMAVELIENGGFEKPSVNFMFGPSKLTQLSLGAKYGPCMVPNPEQLAQTPYVPCPTGYNGTLVNGTCTIGYYEYLSFYCKMGGFTVPNQYWRFVTPLFLHVGLIELAITIVFQIWKGFEVERDIGPIRMAIIYFGSGIFGIAWATTMAPNLITVCPQGPLFAILGLLYLDLFQNWQLLLQPWKWFIILTTIVIILFLIGLLPYIDNYSHIGGFGMGILFGLILVPYVSFGKWDGLRKKIALLVSIPVVILFYFGVFYSIYGEGESSSHCPYCSALDCVPVNSAWCAQSSLTDF